MCLIINWTIDQSTVCYDVTTQVLFELKYKGLLTNCYWLYQLELDNKEAFWSWNWYNLIWLWPTIWLNELNGIAFFFFLKKWISCLSFGKTWHENLLLKMSKVVHLFMSIVAYDLVISWLWSNNIKFNLPGVGEGWGCGGLQCFISPLGRLEKCFFFPFISHSAHDWFLQLFGNNRDFSSSWVSWVLYPRRLSLPWTMEKTSGVVY